MKRRAVFLIVVLLALSLALPALAQESVTHIIQPGETLFRISQQYGVSVEAIATANDIANTWTIFSGQALLIPPASASLDELIAAAQGGSANEIEATVPEEAAPPVEAADEERVEAEPVQEQIHEVAWGESLGSIASRYNMSMEELARINNITNPDLIYSGQQLVIVPGSAISSDSGSYRGSSYSSVTHIVQPGDNLVHIGERYNVSWLQIAQANSITDADRVMPGMELVIPGGEILPDVEYSFVTAPAAPPARVGTGREVIVDLSEQRVYAYEDGVLVRSVIVSTGLPATPTVQGSFTVQRKYVAQTMTGPGYYLPDVPYVMYFYAGYALHGTYWHENFGQPMSHGCVNLPTPEADWFSS
ncbi:MAG: LysM peptidoglycan-binding domain-containing protein, partial [Anaerolineae bacterium]|nr:LysM peptidoglycan-binding domain-containing protein [Anaerolineae bacterium]